MKKRLCLLLCAALLCAPLCGCAGQEPTPAAPSAPVTPSAAPVTASAAPSGAPEEPGFADTVEAQAFAATMACWLNDFKAGDDPADPPLPCRQSRR